MNKKKIYVAYGSNMNIIQMGKRCPAAEKMCTGILIDYQLEFRGGGVATIIPKKGSEVPVVIWNITQGCEKVLDIYEGFPRLYIKDNVQVESELGLIAGMAYVMADNYSRYVSRPNSGYYTIIKEGYEQNNISIKPLEEALKTAMRA
jgi:hypothetical protein